MFKNLIHRWTLLMARRYKLVIGVSIAIVILSLSSASKLTVKGDFVDLLPQDLETVRELKRTEDLMGGIGYIIVAIESEDLESSKNFMLDLAEKMKGDDRVRFIDKEIDIDFFQRNALLYLNETDLKELKERLSRRIEFEKLKASGLFFDFSGGEIEENELNFDDIQEKYTKKWGTNKYYLSNDGKLLCFLIKPNFLSSDTTASKKLVSDIKKTISSMGTKKYHPSLKTTLTGRYVLQADQQDYLKTDSVKVSLISLVGVVLFLILYFRHKRSPLLLGLPLVTSMIASMGFASLIVDSLDIISSSSLAVLMGLGIDFSIHVYSRYLEERKNDPSIINALVKAQTSTGDATLPAALTTSVAFFALIFSNMAGFRNYGIIAGTSIMICWVASYSLFPASIILAEKIHAIRSNTINGHSIFRKFYQPTSHKYLFIATVVFTIFSLWVVASQHIYFDYNFENLASKNPRQALDDKIGSIFSASVTPEIITTSSMDDAKILSQAINNTRDKNKKSGIGSTIDFAYSIFDFIPENQPSKKVIISEIRDMLNDQLINKVRAEESKRLADLRKMLSPGNITISNLPKQVITKFKDRLGNIGQVVYVFPSIELMQGKDFFNFVDELRSVPHEKCRGPITFSGEAFIFADILRNVFSESNRIIAITLLSVILLVLIFTRNLKTTILSLIPLFVGLAWMFAILYILSIKITLFSITMIPIIIGLGIDYGIHITHRYVEEGGKNIVAVVKHLERPILAVTITSMIGYGALMFASNKGLKSLGILALIGLSSCMIASLVGIPIIIHFWEKRVSLRRMSRDGSEVVPKQKCDKIALFLMTIITGLTLSNTLFANSSINIPSSDPVYRQIDKLVAAGLAKDVIVGQRPFSRDEVARIVSAAIRNFPTLEKNLLKKNTSVRKKIQDHSFLRYLNNILKDLGGKYKLQSNDPPKHKIEVHGLEKAEIAVTLLKSEPRIIPENTLGTIEAQTNPLVDNREGRHFVNGSNIALEWLSWAELTKYLAVNITPRLEMLNNSGAAGYDSYKLLAQNLYGKLTIKNLEFEVGRDSILWGQGTNSGILISNNARSMDMIKLSNQHPFRLPFFLKYIGDIKVTFFLGNLGPDWSFPYAYLAGAKLSIKPFHFFEIGASQALIMGGEGSPNLSLWDGMGEFFAYRQGIGFTPNDQDSGADPNLSNRIMGLDARFTIPCLRGTQVYYEIFTEACCGVFDQLYAYSGGIYIPQLTNSGQLDFRVEYTHTPAVFYRHGNFTPGWTLNNKLIGNSIGPYGDAINFTTHYDLADQNFIGAIFSFEKRKNDLITTSGPISTATVAEDRPDENRYRFEIEGSFKIKKNLTVLPIIGYERVKRFNFSENNNHNNFLFALTLSVDLDRFFSYYN